VFAVFGCCFFIKKNKKKKDAEPIVPVQPSPDSLRAFVAESQAILGKYTDTGH